MPGTLYIQHKYPGSPPQPANNTLESTNSTKSVIVSWMYNNTKDVEIWVNNTLRVSRRYGLTILFASRVFLVKLERERERNKDAGGAKNKNPPVGDPVV
jgi:hypothetical protein